jgi:hypothetical protein
VCRHQPACHSPWPIKNIEIGRGGRTCARTMAMTFLPVRYECRRVDVLVLDSLTARSVVPLSPAQARQRCWDKKHCYASARILKCVILLLTFLQCAACTLVSGHRSALVWRCCGDCALEPSSASRQACLKSHGCFISAIAPAPRGCCCGMSDNPSQPI